MNPILIILGALALLLLSGSIKADDHGGEENFPAVALQSSICQLKEGKTLGDLDKALGPWRKWASSNNYDSFVSQNTPIYMGGDVGADVIWMEASPFELLGNAWESWLQDGASAQASIDKVVTCKRSLASFWRQYVADGFIDDEDRILQVNWCTRRDGISWSDIGERHRAARENMNSNIGAWGVMFPAKGMREGDYPGEFAHMMLFTDMTALMRYQEDFTNGGGWRAREEYYNNFASCTGENVYSSRVINRPASAWAE